MNETDLIRKSYNTTLNKSLMKQLKMLSIQLDKRHNDMIEEAILDLLIKYGNMTRSKRKTPSQPR